MASEATSRDRSAVDWTLLVARAVVGVIFMAHGAQKLFGAFGGPGLSAVVQMMGPLGYLVTVGEFFGGLGLVFGFLSRFSAASIIVIMLGGRRHGSREIRFLHELGWQPGGRGFRVSPAGYRRVAAHRDRRAGTLRRRATLTFA